LNDQFNRCQDKLKELHKQTDILKEKYERYSEEPAAHLNRINETASNAFQHIEQLDDKANAATRKPLKEIAAGLHSVLQYIQEGNFKEAASWFLKTKSVANSLHPSQHDVTEVKGLLENVISLQKEFEAYRDKKMVTPNERENRLEQFFDAYKDSEEKLKQHADKVEQLSSQLPDMKDDPQVKDYLALHQRMSDLHQQLDAITPAAEKHWQQSLAKLNPEGDEETGDYSDDAQVKKWKEAQKYTPGDEGTDWDEKIPEDVDLENEEQAAGVGSNILGALKDKLHGHEHFIFGGEGHKKGLLHIAHHMLWKLYTGGDATKLVEDILNKYPKDGEAPEFYKENKVLHDQKRWRRLHNIEPGVAAKYAILFSDYNPVPYAEPDLYDEKHAELFKDLFQDLKGKGYDLPKDQKTAQWQYYQLFRVLGNHIIEQMIKDKPGQKEIFDKIRSLNKPHTATGDDSSRYPGKLRRNLERRMDVLYGRYAKKFPTHWAHSYEKPLEHWLKKIGVKPEEEEDYGKSLIVFSDKLAKAEDVRLVVNRK
jgi:hypothetical protein